MRTFVLAVVALLMAVPALAETKVTVPQGTKVKVSLTEKLSSEKAKIGDEIRFTVAEDVVVKDHIIVAKGATAYGEVAGLVKRGVWGISAGMLSIAISRVESAGGGLLKIEFQKDIWGEGRRGVDLPGSNAGGRLDTPVFLPGGKAKHAVIEAGTEITVFIDSQPTIEID
jgi:hypothetical protein